MSVLLIGCNGSMGKRYQAILKFLGKSFVGIDKDHTDDMVKKLAADSTGFIIATPTATHESFIKRLAVYSRPILCEKPIIRGSEDKFTELMAWLRAYQTPLRMMLQYEMLCDTKSIGPSHYDYYNHGSDGLVWDCMQVIGLARSGVTLKEESPVWSCKINGRTINRAHMDAAYIGYVQKWFRDPKEDPEYLSDFHAKVRDFEGKYK